MKCGFFREFEATLGYAHTIYILDTFCAGAIKLVLAHKNGDFGAISVTERSCAVPISKAEIESYIGSVHING